MPESMTADLQHDPHGPEARVTAAIPVQSCNDPMPPARLGMWLFLASEAMFFIGLLSAFIVLGSTGEQHALFAGSAKMLSISIAIVCVLVAIASSVAMSRQSAISRWLAVAAALLFCVTQSAQWRSLLTHQTTVVQNLDGRSVAYEQEPGPLQGNFIRAHALDLPDHADLSQITPSDLDQSSVRELGVHLRTLRTLNYGPSRNNFFACYFLITTAHVIHLLAGMLVVLYFLLFAKGKLPDSVQIYWHFVNAVGVIGILALYFI
jgi:heme/copper-type cytochrome/quinol oxidase subunit 3